MAPSVSQVREWTLGDLTATAVRLRLGATDISQSALRIIDGLGGIGSDWAGEARDAATVRAKDHASSMQEKARRWTTASGVLDTAAQQLGLLREAILEIVDNAENQRLFAISDYGVVTIRTDVEAYDDNIQTRRATLEDTLRMLLLSAEAAAQMYDWQVTNALMGVSDAERPFTPHLPPPRELPTTGPGSARERADRDGSGDEQWRTWKPDLTDQVKMQAVRAFWEEGGSFGSNKGMENFNRLLRHFFDNTGTQASVSVDAMLRDLPGFQAATNSLSGQAVERARAVMPAGYTGPVAFQSGYTGSYTPDWETHPDWFFTLGTFTYQTSGVAMPSDQGAYTIAAQTTVYDYYNFDARGKLGMLNDLNRAGWARTFDTTGTSSPQWSHSR
ncbi:MULTISPECIES: hypothetical protein [Mycobacterium]|uniref:hypothetical protein n=1 Tax=Mycobacterium TaxID=1763 RepID=UPI001EE15C52|nr:MULTISPECIES: hypothetical protein [Mycobacterium]BDE17400.1 hypothetical protein MKCMC460_62600 [Mycobacterium sp. 20KCMC460]GLB93123.1 hypothetical protein SRL2020130_59400 [Mycobacterium kiyosense]GLC05266.1 hypothetical protein SRL2020400_58570 [Mycobacterium kiyosense]GLC11323.1 hypothetical protein SRL2020411_59690 [Mycobacterium kiyosense]GLC17348.1 hypothetical protein SRL2020448_59510 [Mycobacterium kiyosense]